MASEPQSQPVAEADTLATTATPMDTDDAPPAADRNEQQPQPQERQQQQETAANPPPPPPPPLPPLESPPQPPAPQRAAAAPGPRASRLQDLYAQSLRRTLGKLRWDNFAACYPTVSRRAEPVLRQVQAQMVDKLGDKCEKEFENILVARQVVLKLNELETLINDASRRRTTSSSSSANAPEPTPPHLLPASHILAAHLAPSLASHQSLLNARLQTAQSHNAILYDHIRRQRADIDALISALEAAVADVRGANAALAPLVGQLAAEARQAHVDVCHGR